MSGINPTNVAISSLLGGYGAVQQTAWASMLISGTVAFNATANFTTSISADQSNPNYMWDIIGYNPTADSFTNVYSLLNTSNKFGIDTFIYQSALGGETTTFSTSWNQSTNSFVITCSIFNGANNGNPLTLVTQTAYFSGIYYPAPF